MGLKEIRKAKGLSRKQVSELTGISLRSLQDYEQRHKNLAKAKSETLYRLSLVLGCTMEELFEKDLFQELIEPESLCPRPNYHLDATITQNRLESQKIFCSKYQVYGKWKLTASHCLLIFFYDGALVHLPFDVFFSEKTLPWLVDAAKMKMESYIDNVLFNQQPLWKGGSTWDDRE